MHSQSDGGERGESNPSSSADRGLFPLTRWSVIAAARSGSETVVQRALEDLCEIYWYPLYAFARVRGFSPHDAEDITQGFLARFLARHDFERVDQEKGRLRSYLLASLKHYIASWSRRNCQQKRKGSATVISIDQALAEKRFAEMPVDNASPDLIYEKQWAVTLLQRVMRRLEDEFSAKGKGDIFDALRGHLSLWERDKPYAQAAAELGVSEGTLKVTAHRMRHRYRELLCSEIADTVGDDVEVDAEIDHFFQIFN